MRGTVVGMLGTLGYERTILGSAERVVEAAAFSQLHRLTQARVAGIRPKTALCTVCSLPPSHNVVLYDCGHLTHDRCERRWGICSVCGGGVGQADSVRMGDVNPTHTQHYKKTTIGVDGRPIPFRLAPPRKIPPRSSFPSTSTALLPMEVGEAERPQRQSAGSRHRNMR